VRDLPEVRRAGDLVWFQPALNLPRTLRHEADPRLTGFFAGDSPLYIARAPGRLDVMGGIADYSGARVLELPLACSIAALVRRQAAPRCDVATRRAGEWQFFSVDSPSLLADGRLGTRAALAAWLCLQRAARDGSGAPPGLRLLIDSTVPEGKGVASSAALEVATGAAVAATCGIEVTAAELARGCQTVENEVVGAPCGLMDQMTSACGQRDRLLALRCQPGTIEGYLQIPAGFRFYGIDSGIRHAISSADYGTVRTAAFMGYRMIADAAGLPATRDGSRVHIDDPRWRGYLANLTGSELSELGSRLPAELSGADFLQRYDGITDAATHVLPDRRYPVRPATEHPVREQARVDRFAELLGAPAADSPQAVELGRLMYDSHASYGACGLGSNGTDRLVELVVEAGPERGLFGAKITGGGSGGTVAVLGTSEAEAVVREVAARYRAETGRDVVVFTDSGPGMAETGVLMLAPDELSRSAE